MRIFLIENNDHTRESLSAFLEEDGHEIIAMRTGEDALRTFRLDPAPVVILDLLLVGFGSLDLLETIKSEHPETEVIVTTSFPSFDSVVDVMRLDALDYLVKTDGLFDSINSALTRAKENIHRRQQEKINLAALYNKVTDLELTNSQLALNICDPQTGLYDQRLFEESVAAEIDRGRQNNRVFSIILIRLNSDPQGENENFETRAAEGSLQPLVKSIRERLRKSDLLARYDDQTLSIILPETGREGATLVAESISGLCIDLITSIIGDQPLPQSILQVGVACFPEDGSDQTELLDMAGQTTTVYSNSIH